MTNDCEMIRDLLPLYADEVCSPRSREAVEEHIRECPECRSTLARLLDGRIEQNLLQEKQDVIRYGTKRFRRRSAAVGAVISGLFMIPILVCLIVNITSGAGLGWFFVVLAALAVAASLIVVPLMAPDDKAFWTFCAFCVSLMVLLAVVCLYVRGNWFWIASSATLFGLAVIFLPFVVRARLVQRLIGDSSRLMIVLGTDAVLFVNMMSRISAHGRASRGNLLFTAGAAAGLAMIVLEIMKKRGNRK